MPLALRTYRRPHPCRPATGSRRATCRPCSSPQGPRADSCENTALLGPRLPRPAAVSHPIKPDSRLLTVTDGLGLVETWDSNLFRRPELPSSVAATGPEEPDALRTTLLETFATEPADDIIVFAARLRPPEPPDGNSLPRTCTRPTGHRAR
ncbi:SpoIIE family protein phosphatase [Streptomyces sp. NPDC088358]|uniref:SpoIIE family protein phosphatase n=1 Tax=Streptomyces sp. NPDC088358 TaxID=3365857 RepID=UPI0037F83C1D